jgi:hypothetical protein
MNNGAERTKKRFGMMMNKKAEDEALHMVLGLVLLALIIVAVVAITSKGGKAILAWIGDKVSTGIEQAFNPDSLYSLASTTNFERLNTELSELLKGKSLESRTLPYTLGQYRLVGFNKEGGDSLNSACLSEAIVKARGNNCKGKACLCLCYMEEYCQCKEYPDVDYFITTKSQVFNNGKVIDDLLDPVTNESVSCLMIKGAVNEDDHIKIIEPAPNWWGSNEVYIQKIDKAGKRYVFFSRYSDVEYTSRIFKAPEGGTNIDLSRCPEIKSCMDYQKNLFSVDWRFACENDICSDTNNLICSVRKNPLGTTEAERTLCIKESEKLSDVCIPGNATESVPKEGVVGELVWLESKGICMRCEGIGTAKADHWGWGQDSTIDEAHCEVTH